MTKEILSAINKCLDLYSCFIACFIIFSIYINNKNRTKIDKLFALTCLVDFLLALFDFISIQFESDLHPSYYYIMKISLFLFYTFGIIIYNVYTYFVCKFFNNENKLFLKINIGCFIGYMIGVVINQFMPFYYYLDQFNVYHRFTYFPVSLFFQFILLLVSIYVTFSPKNKISFSQKLSFVSFFIFPILMHGIQIAFYGISLINVGITLSFFIIFINLNNNLEKSVNDKQIQLKNSEEEIVAIQNNTIMSLSNLVENRDSDTGNHVKRTSIYVKILAKKAQEKGLYPNILSEKYISLITEAAPLHDIGKIVVPDSILKKPGKLTDEEFETMKKHTSEGKRIVYDVLSMGNKDYVNMAAEIATSHHEKWNGSGYPYEISGENIPLSARIMAVADVFDALVSPRCYKPAFTVDKAFEILIKDSGTHFDPNLIPLFIELKPQIGKIMELYGSDL